MIVLNFKKRKFLQPFFAENDLGLSGMEIALRAGFTLFMYRAQD
jgi:hypothetical protein